jgi:hypothetical protein
MIYTVPRVIVLRWADTLCGEVGGGGLALEISSFLAPNGTPLLARAISRGPKTLDFQRQPPAPHLPI